MLDKAQAHGIVLVTDRERAKQFYERCGLKVSADVSTGVFMEAADGSILALIHRPDVTPAGHTVAGFQVEDLNGTVGSLKEAGIEFEEYDSPGLKTVDSIADLGAYQAAFIKDPDGNYLGIHEPPS